jgi:hypothetical protein
VAVQRYTSGVAAVAVACATGMAVVACGGGGGDPLASMSAKQVLTKAESNLKAAPTFGFSGSMNESEGRTTVHLDYKQGTGCKGTIAVAGQGSFALTVIGTTAWVQPDDAFWRTYAGSNAAQAIALFHGRYLKGSTTNANVASLTKLCDVNSLVSQLGVPTDVAKGKVTTLDGQQVLPLTDKAKGGTLYVTDTGSPQIVQLVNTTAGNSGKVTFTVGNKVTLTPPPASQSIDGSSFGF